MTLLKLFNGTILTPSGTIRNGTLMIRDGKIDEITDANIETDCPQLDVKGSYIAPGCIDIHTHGGAGHDFYDATPEAFIAIAEAHARHGMTSLYPTIAVSPNETFYRVFDVFEQLKTVQHNGANLPGIHLEGNYLNPVYKGGQNPLYLALPDEAEYRDMLEHSPDIKRWSISPELPGAIEMGRYISRRGVLPSIAHTNADHQTVVEAYKNGYTHATHLYSAMSTIHKEREYKYSGVVESVYLIEEMTAEVIADGIHLPHTLLQFAYKFKGPEKVALITDAMELALCPGMKVTHDGRVIIEDGVAKLADRSAIAGSIATSDRLIRTMIAAGIPLHDAIRMAAETPATIMGIQDRKGTLCKGMDADVIVFDKDINIQTTIIGGRIVHNLI